MTARPVAVAMFVRPLSGFASAIRLAREVQGAHKTEALGQLTFAPGEITTTED